MKRRRPHNILSLETLEARSLMSGNVSALVQGKDLVLRGDTADNQIQILRRSATTFRLRGTEGTMINGKAYVDLSGQSLKIFFQQGGADQISVAGNVQIASDLTVNMAGGTVTLDGTLGPVRVGRNLWINNTAGDVTLLNDVRVQGKSTINAGGNVNVAAGKALLPDLTRAQFNDSLTIDNQFLPLVPGTRYTYRKDFTDEDTGLPTTEITVVDVLAETKTILGIECRVVLDRNFHDGVLVESTFDWFAQDDQGNVWYMGEAVTNYEYDDAGNLIGTNSGGSFEAGKQGAKPGVVMLANPRVGERYYQEYFAGEALDQAEILGIGETVSVSAGTFRGTLTTRDTTVLEIDAFEVKSFAPGLGSVRTQKLDPESGKVVETTRLISATQNGRRVIRVVPAVPVNGVLGQNPAGRVTAGVWLNDDVSIGSGGEVFVEGTTFNDLGDIDAFDDIIVVNSDFTNSVELRAEEAVTLRETSAHGRVLIESDGDVHVIGSKLFGQTDVRFGAGANTLLVKNSTFNWLRADGGLGVNELVDLGGNTFARLDLIRFN